MKRLGLIVLCLVLVTTGLTSFWPFSPQAAAISGSNWQAGRIIDDTEFTDANSMTVGQIQNFLNNQVPSCDTWGTQPATEWGHPNETHAQFAASQGWSAPPYVCLKEYYEVPKTSPATGVPDNSYNHYDSSTQTLLPVPGGISAAQIIYNAAQQYQINPQVLLTKIQTESSGPLTQDTWPLQSQYTYAMGADCPDSGPGGSAQCDPDYSGFSMQIYQAASLLRYYLDNMQQSWWQYKVPYATNSILWNVSASGCGASNVYIQSKATAALYTYTPYQPNAAALANVSNASSGGTGNSCSAYGNRNFWWWYSHWFGSTLGPMYAWQELSKQIYTDSTETTPLSWSNIQPNEYFYIAYNIENTGAEIWNTSTELGRTGNEASVFCTQDWITCARPAAIQQNDVEPGQTATLGFWARAPSQPGNYKEYYDLLIENVAWYVDIGSYIPITVTGPAYQTDTLSYGQKAFLKVGESLLSPNGQDALTLTVNGDLEIRHNGQLVWDTGTTTGFDLVAQSDGNLVLYDRSGNVLWSQGSPSCTGTTKLQITNGSAAYTCSDGTSLWSQSWTESPATDSLTSGDIIYRGQSIRSANGLYTLMLQGDGNLVLYGPQGAVWATNTGSGMFLAQQPDGNLVLYNQFGAPLWATNRGGQNTITYVQGDGNIVSYSNGVAVWARH